MTVIKTEKGEFEIWLNDQRFHRHVFNRIYGLSSFYSSNVIDPNLEKMKVTYGEYSREFNVEKWDFTFTAQQVASQIHIRILMIENYLEVCKSKTGRAVFGF